MKMAVLLSGKGRLTYMIIMLLRFKFIVLFDKKGEIIKNATKWLENDYLENLMGQKGVITARTKRLFPRHINDLFVERLSFFMELKVRKIENIKKHAQHLHLSYVYDKKIEPFNYYHRRNRNPPNPVDINARFSTRVPVNLTRSHVQVPTEIFRNHVFVLNDARMNEPLDATFLWNYKDDSTLLWQYFCSEAGVHRVFPGEK